MGHGSPKRSDTGDKSELVIKPSDVNPAVVRTEDLQVYVNDLKTFREATNI